MKLGKPIWYGDKPLEEALRKASKLGFDYVELSLDFPWPKSFVSKEIKLLEKIKEEFGLELAFHGPWSFPLASTYEEISCASFKVYEKCLEFTNRLNPLYFNLPLISYEPTLKFKEIEEIAFKIATNSLLKIVELCNSPITVENNSYPFFGKPNQFKRIFQEIEKCYFCFDVGHAIIVKFQNKKSLKKINFKNWLTILKDKILVVHLHDCLIENKEPIDHLPIGKGSLDFEEIVSLIKKTRCNYVLVETLRLKDGRPIRESDLKESLEICRSLFSR